LSESEFMEFENLPNKLLWADPECYPNGYCGRQTKDICPPSALHLSAKQILTHS